MGGMNNKTSIEASNAKINSKKYHAKENEKLYKEYIDSGQQYSLSFVEWKNSKKIKHKDSESMQLPLTFKELKEKRYNTKSSNQLIRWK